MIIAFTLFLCLLMATVVLAEPAERYYLRLQGAESSFSGDFDGKNAGEFVNNSGIKVVTPDIDNDTGYGIVFGAEKGRLFGEFSYLNGKYDSKIDPNLQITIDGSDTSLTTVFGMGKTTVERFGFDVKYAFIDPDVSKIIPFGLLGISRDCFSVKNGAVEIVENADDPSAPSTITRDKARYKGWGYKIGVGVLLRLHDKLALEGSYTISTTNLDHVKAFSETRDPDYKVNSQVIAMSLNYYF